MGSNRHRRGTHALPNLYPVNESATATEAARIGMTDAHRHAINGVVEVIKALRDLPDEIRYLKDRIISNLLWVVTEFKPGTKHKVNGVRWRTPAAHALVVAGDTKNVRHEHVIERRWMIVFLNEHPDEVKDALWNYPACLVTVDEHMALGKGAGWGWDRYIQARLTVIDAETASNLELSKAHSELRATYERLHAELGP